MENYIDTEGNVIVLKSVRPIIDYPETILGSKRGAIRQFRYGNLHIREYDDHYTAHLDKIDPRKDPIGHLLIDAPEYLIPFLPAFSFAKHAANERRRAEGNDAHNTSSSCILSASIPGFIIGTVCGIAMNFIRNWSR